MRTKLLFVVLMLAAAATPTRSWAFIAVPSPTLGKVVSLSNNIVLLRVEKVSREKQVVVYTKVADLKGVSAADTVKHKLADGSRPRYARTILDWAEPGEVAVCFTAGNASLTCIGSFWYEGAPGADGWTIMTVGRPNMGFAYSGSVSKLRDAVGAIVAGKEVVVTALKYEAMALGPGKTLERKLDHWATFEAVASARLMRGKEWPLWRLKASLDMPPQIVLLIQEPGWIVGDGPAGADDVPALVKALDGKDAPARIEAAEVLGMMGKTAAHAEPALLPLFRDADPLVCVAAAKAAADIDPKNEAAIPLLVEALKADAAKVRRRAAESLGDLGPGARPAVAALVQAVKDADPAVRWAAIDALGQIGPDAAEAVPALLEALNDAESRAVAVDSLGQMGHKSQAAIPALEKALTADDVAVRWPAAAALVRMGGPGAKAGTRYLLAASRDSGRNKNDATNILMAPTAREALPELIDAVRDPDLRDPATEVVLDVSTYLQRDQLPDVRKWVDDADVGVRCVAAFVLHTGRVRAGEVVDAKDVIAVQRQGLSAADPWVRRQAARFLGKLGPQAKDAAEALSGLLQDPD
ncbi:MAG TPA: HEAT repeat domain-containing protein, partial [Gemmataceae bacterium]|nr:HEAT repeat domain-containing protein [Gemmataceae bacterium]